MALSSRSSMSASSSPTPRSASAPKAATPKVLPEAPPPVPTPPAALGDDDEFLRQIREVRSAMSNDAQWFKDQSERFEEEERQNSETGSNQGHQQSPPQPVYSPSAGAGQVNGHEFIPSASGIYTRSEHRLRRTGGYGLANRPVDDYLPGGSRYVPAMSKRGAAAYQASKSSPPARAANQSAKHKGKRKVSDPAYRYESDHDSEEEAASQRKKIKRKVNGVQQGDVNGVPANGIYATSEDYGAFLLDHHNYEEDVQLAADHRGPMADEDGYDDARESFDENEAEHYGQENLQAYAAEAESDEEEAEEYEGYSESMEQTYAEEGFDEDGEEDDGDAEEYDEESEDELSPLKGTNLKGREIQYGPLKRRLRSHTPEEPYSENGHSRSSRSVSQGFQGDLMGSGATEDDALVLSD